MPNDAIATLVVAVGIGIINISIGVALLLLLSKAAGKVEVGVIIGWTVFVILAISIFGTACLISTIPG